MKPKKCISVEEARNQQNEWVRTRGKDIERGEGYEDTREFWYSLDELQEYLDYVREKSAEQGVKKPGIRFYLGAYPKGENKKSYSTIFLAATKEKENKDVEDEEGQNENNYEIEPMNTITSGMPPKIY
ncbi:hypothetical protein GCM10007103_08540 [Salinimicrobium marinum]|uniref:Uncharacterized protein n=1 Tax=Salinimicrobium marinum TaxID=680283 RepID=A0A918S8Y1_9FLAO|nr:hypothetical protein [Salinimicrobium marinum]GHA29601.1 hypothetical protein GCM10007103_08540 [Salinimicrobium marinum]